MEDWKQILPKMDVENIKNFALPVIAKRYVINGEILDIPDYSELVNMIVSLSDKITTVKLNKFIEATANVVAKIIKPIYERLDALEKKEINLEQRPETNTKLIEDVDKIKADVVKIKEALFPKDFIKSFIVEPKTEK